MTTIRGMEPLQPAPLLNSVVRPQPSLSEINPMRNLPKTTFILLPAILAVAPAYSQARSASHPNHSSFRYIIFNDVLLHNGRLVLVLLDAKSFSEPHLRELFELISKRFHEPDELHVAVFTNLEQI